MRAVGRWVACYVGAVFFSLLSAHVLSAHGMKLEVQSDISVRGNNLPITSNSTNHFGHSLIRKEYIQVSDFAVYVEIIFLSDQFLHICHGNDNKISFPGHFGAYNAAGVFLKPGSERWNRRAPINFFFCDKHVNFFRWRAPGISPYDSKAVSLGVTRFVVDAIYQRGGGNFLRGYPSPFQVGAFNSRFGCFECSFGGYGGCLVSFDQKEDLNSADADECRCKYGQDRGVSRNRIIRRPLPKGFGWFIVGCYGSGAAVVAGAYSGVLLWRRWCGRKQP